MSLMIWLTAGFGGVFWIAYGYAQLWYFLTVAGVIIVVLCATRYFELSDPAAIVSSALGGYAGSVISYSGLSFAWIVRSINNENYLLLIRPFIFPYHLTFVLAGLCAALLVIAMSKAYGS